MTKVYDTATDLITFARSSSGTALRRVGYGDELVASGDFPAGLSDGDVGYDNGDGTVDGWTNVNASTTSVVSGRLRIQNGASGRSGAGRSFSTTVGKTYTLTVDVIAGTSAAGQVLVGSALNDFSVATALSVVGDGLQLTFVAADVTTFVTLRPQQSGAGLYVDFDNISVREVIFDRPTDDLVLFNHPEDIPRIEYGSDGSLKGLLIEEQRTNLIVDSNDPTTANWATKTTNATQDLTGPDGVVNSAWTLEDDNAAGYEFNETVVGIDAGAATYYATVFVLKDADTSRVAEFQLSATGGASKFHYVQINTSTGETANKNVSGGSTISVDDFGDWWRLGFDITNSGGNTSLAFKVLSAGGASLGSSSNASTGSIGIYGAQLEEGSFPTSYIPTAGSQQTRSADLASIPVTAFGYNQDAGTVVAEYSMVAGAFSGSPYIVQFDDGSAGSRFLIMELSNQSRFFMNDGGVTQDTIVNEPISEGVLNKTAVAFVENSTGVSTNGSVAEAGDGTSTVPGGVTTVRLGGSTSTNDQLNGHIKSIQYYPRRLTDAQLQELTA